MENKVKQEFIQMLKEARGTDQEWSVIMAMVDMLEDDEEFERIAELYKGKAEFGQYLSEREARKIVDGFRNYDGSRGPKWAMPQMLFDTVEAMGGARSEKGRYNCWSLYVMMNMMHSNYGGALLTAVQGESYAKMCYMLSVAWFNDIDHKNDIRHYFGLE